MKNRIFNIKPMGLALVLAGIGMTQPSYAVDLVAIEGQWSPDGGATHISMWGFAPDMGQDCASLPAWSIGPQLTDADLVAGDLTINLRNCLSEPVSIIIPGQPATFTPQTITPGDGRTRVTAFTHEAPGNGTASYTWSGVKAGTYLYQSGSHPAKQVQMGLYGALTVGGDPGTSGDVTLLYSEIDPALHSPPAAATPLGYHPRHFLINGSTSQSGIAAGDTNQPTLLRFLNAGLDFHVPALNGGHMSLVAEDGNPYPFAREQYSVNLAAGKTIDVLWQPATAGTHVIYDRRGNGMVASLTVTAGIGAPVAVDDSYVGDEDLALSAGAPGVLANDSALTTAILVSAPSSGVLDPGLAADGSFTYTPNADFNGSDSFSYKANDGSLDSNIAIVTITVNPINDPPVAGDNVYDAVEGETVSIAEPGLLENDIDIDNVSLVIDTTPVAGPANGILALSADGSFTYTPSIAAPTSDSFIYEVCDAEPLCDTATVNINIIAASNVAPVAVGDTFEVLRNSPANNLDLTINDSDVDGNLKDDFGHVAAAQITITTGAKTTRGGTVSKITDGVNYTPKRNFRGTDTFNYTVTDLDGAESSEVTVRINVVRP